MAGSRPIASGPSFSSLPYGLWEAVQHPAPPDHWQNGVTYVERCPAASSTYDECLTVTGTGSPPAPPSKAPTFDQVFRGATAFTVFTQFDCSPVGLEQAQDAATEALVRSEQRQVETSFWTGVSGGQKTVFPRLAADAEVISGSDVLQSAASVCVTGTDIVYGLGALEQCLASCYGGQGLIHAAPAVLPTLAAWGLAEDRDGALWTPSGNRIVVGTGYPGTSPSGAAPAAGTSWIYATGAAFGYRGDVTFTRPPESLNRSTNTLHMIAERTYVIGYECCLIAALVNLGVPES